MKPVPHSHTILTEFFKNLGIEVVSVEEYDFFGSVALDVHINDTERPPSEVWRAVQQILTQFLEKEIGSQKIVIDINSENKHKLDVLQEKTKNIAARAKELKCSIELEPMNSFERMVVHETIKNIDGVETLSQGEGALRHVVVKSAL